MMENFIRTLAKASGLQLPGSELDDAVGKALGWVDYPTDSIERGRVWHLDKDEAPFGRVMYKHDWKPSTDGQQCMNLIEEHVIALARYEHRDGILCDAYWVASWTGAYDSMHYGNSVEAGSAQIAVCLAVIESKK